MNTRQKYFFLMRRIPEYVKYYGGILGLLRKTIDVISQEGIKGIKKRILAYENRLKTPLSLQLDIAEGKYRSLNEIFGEEEKNRLVRLVQGNQVKIVSFDIFDTLLVRLCLRPEDVFWLVASEVNKKYAIDYYKIRKDASSRKILENANLEEIYAWIASKYKLSKPIVSELMRAEVRVEKQILVKRQEIYEIYQAALRAGKKVIAISDMYLPKCKVREILTAAGYDEITDIYISCEYGKRKSSGALFSLVLNEQRCEPSRMIHIGDNFFSDYKEPLKKGVLACYVPSVVDIFLASNTLWARSYQMEEPKDPLPRIILGYLFLYVLKKYKNDSAKVLSTCNSVGALGLGPALAGAIVNLMNFSELKKFKRIYFASRDGFLLYKIFGRLKELNYEIPEPVYFPASRVFYYSATNDNFEKFITPDLHACEIEVGVFIDNYIQNAEYNRRIKSLFTESDLLITSSNPKWGIVLRKAQKLIEEYIAFNNKRLQKYYSTIFLEKDCIIFDCGYSGSIAVALQRILPEKQFNKIYLWQTIKNKELDRKNKTFTFSLFGDLDIKKYGALNLAFEELMSPLQGSAVAIDQNGQPVFQTEYFSELMIRDLQECQLGALGFCQSFFSAYNRRLLTMEVCDISCLLSHFNVSMNYSPYCEAEILKNIKFSDIAINQHDSLAKKLENTWKYDAPILGSGFYNPENYLRMPDFFGDQLSMMHKKIGVHIHLYDTSLIYEIVDYLQRLPDFVDVFVTSPKIEAKEQLFNILDSLTSFVRKPKVIITPNRGRDVGPWIVEFNGIHDEYEYFAHVHGKRSVHMKGYGDVWRKYLLDNLLTPKALNEIIYFFEHDKKLGCVFPGPFLPVLNVWKNQGVEVIGENKKILETLCKKVFSKDYEFLKSDMFFSTGTMFWYRPEAFKNLFLAGIRYDDFPSEPIGLDNTLAHAIERIIKISCDRQGFRAQSWTSVHRNLTFQF